MTAFSPDQHRAPSFGTPDRRLTAGRNLENSIYGLHFLPWPNLAQLIAMGSISGMADSPSPTTRQAYPEFTALNWHRSISGAKDMQTITLKHCTIKARKIGTYHHTYTRLAGIPNRNMKGREKKEKRKKEYGENCHLPQMSLFTRDAGRGNMAFGLPRFRRGIRRVLQNLRVSGNGILWR